MNQTIQVDFLIVGGGAAGFFAAARLHELNPKASICLLEASNKVLSKVKISGGGRCNVTHAQFDLNAFASNYPRGERFLKTLFNQFNASHTVDWFAKRGVKLVAEQDGRMFPQSNVSQTVIDCLMSQVPKQYLQVKLGQRVMSLSKTLQGWKAQTSANLWVEAQKVLVATGGGARTDAFSFLPKGLNFEPLVPSLFTFNLNPHVFTNLPGVATNATLHLLGTKLRTSGPLLITHWGLSGPAALRMSAWDAYHFHAFKYKAKLHIDFTNQLTEDTCRQQIIAFAQTHPKKMIVNSNLLNIPSRLWEKLVVLANIPVTKAWHEISKKEMNKLVENLLRFEVQMDGKSVNKDEFVTAGGVDLKELTTHCESIKLPGLYFAGEILAIDGITGGFNFQAAWTTAWVAASDMVLKLNIK